MNNNRLAFKFYKSYYDVYIELNDKDKVLFIDALLKKQFYGIETELKGMAKFAYISQKHNIDIQVKGWEDKQGIKLSSLVENKPIEPPTIPPTIPTTIPPTKEEKEKEKEEEKSKKKEKLKEEIKKYFFENGYTENSAVKFFEYYDCADWKDSKGNDVKSWKQKAQAVWFKDENKITVEKPKTKAFENDLNSLRVNPYSSNHANN